MLPVVVLALLCTSFRFVCVFIRRQVMSVHEHDTEPLYAYVVFEWCISVYSLCKCTYTYVHVFVYFNFVQVQLVSSDGRAGNSSSFTFECSGSAPLAKSIMTVVLCVAMAIMGTIVI